MGLLLVFGLAAPAFHHDLWNPDEPRIANLAQGMLEYGHWLLPSVNGELFVEQPPLQSWLVAACMAVFGHGFGKDWVPRIPSIIFGIGVLWLVLRAARRYSGANAGILAAVCLCTTIEFVVGFHRAIVDTSLTFFVTLAMLQLLEALRRGEAPSWKEALVLGLAGGLSFLAKNLIGVTFIGLVFLALALRHRSIFLSRTSCLRLGVALTLGLLVPLPYLATAAAEDPSVLRILLVDNTVGRFFRSDIHNPPFFEFAHRMLGVLMPWIAVSLVIHLRSIRRWWQQKDNESDRILEGLFWWTVLPMLLVQCSGSKREIYLLPVTPAIALTAGIWLNAHWESRAFKRAAWICIAFCAPLVPLTGLVGGVWGQTLPTEVWAILVLHLAILYSCVRRRLWRASRAPFGVAALLLLTSVCAGTLVYYRAENVRQSYVRLCRDLDTFRQDGLNIVGFRLPLRERSAIPYYLQENIPDLHNETELEEVFSANASPTALVSREPIPERFTTKPHSEYRVRRRIYVYLNTSENLEALGATPTPGREISD